jgi:hypothetical protein
MVIATRVFNKGCFSIPHASSPTNGQGNPNGLSISPTSTTPINRESNLSQDRTSSEDVAEEDKSDEEEDDETKVETTDETVIKEPEVAAFQPTAAA